MMLIFTTLFHYIKVKENIQYQSNTEFNNLKYTNLWKDRF